jgi:hypothetical protein
MRAAFFMEILLAIYLVTFSTVVAYLSYRSNQDARDHEMGLLEGFALEKEQLIKMHNDLVAQLLDRLMAKDFIEYKDNAPLNDTPEEEAEPSSLIDLADAEEEITNA